MIKKTLYFFMFLTLALSCKSEEKVTVDKRKETLKAVKSTKSSTGETDSSGYYNK